MTEHQELPEGRRLAPWATAPADTRGRRHREAESATRSVFQRDRDRIIHSTAFRRLKHKTQVFVYHEGDHYRTRLTHSLEVAQIARSLARALALEEDLAEALALAHDLGHPPFGHAGEEALDAAMAAYGGFDHNGQTLRVVTRLEARYADFDGLNLSWETLEGIAKHNGPLLPAESGLPWSVAECADSRELELESWPGLEAQIASLSDDIAYHAHDLDDGVRAGLFPPEDLLEVPLVGPLLEQVRAAHPGLERPRMMHETIRRLIDTMVGDALAETRRRLAAGLPGSAADVRLAGRPLAGFSQDMERSNKALKSFLFDRMYRHSRVNRMTGKARRVVHDLFDALHAEPQCLPEGWRRRAEAADETGRARLVCDYIAGMTDRFALDEHRRILDVYEENR